MLAPQWGAGQVPAKPLPIEYHNWPLIVSLHFHSLSLPFSDWKSLFANVGLSVGTEVRYNRRATLLQAVQLGYYRNRNAGDGLFLAPQVVYRPRLGSLFAEVRVGAGALYTFHPTEALVLKAGEWQPQRYASKLTLMVPLGVSIGYDGRKSAPSLAPFVSYQVFAQHGYNPSVPIVPHRLLQVGFRSQLSQY